MSETRLVLADLHRMAVDINIAHIINYKKSSIGTDVWVKDDSERGKRLHILSISFAAFETLLYKTDPVIFNGTILIGF